MASLFLEPIFCDKTLLKYYVVFLWRGVKRTQHWPAYSWCKGHPPELLSGNSSHAHGDINPFPCLHLFADPAVWGSAPCAVPGCSHTSLRTGSRWCQPALGAYSGSAASSMLGTTCTRVLQREREQDLHNWAMGYHNKTAVRGIW